MTTTGRKFALCIANDGYPASLLVRRVYEVVPDPEAARHELLRVIDESGEDYLYPTKLFVAVDLPERAKAVFQ